jgi:hypothetical protein
MVLTYDIKFNNENTFLSIKYISEYYKMSNTKEVFIINDCENSKFKTLAY